MIFLKICAKVMVHNENAKKNICVCGFLFKNTKAKWVFLLTRRNNYFIIKAQNQSEVFLSKYHNIW